MKKWYRKGHLYKSGKRSLALLLSVCLIGTMIPVTARAESGSIGTGLCEHHTEHTTECGYVEASEGSPCTYICDICGEEAKQDENIGSNKNLSEQSAEQTEDKFITSWQWMDEDEYLDEETGSLSLPGASEEMPAHFEDVTAFLPTQIQATVVNADDSENPEIGVAEAITLGDWECDNYPKDGAYTGSYTFAAALPEGYALSEEAEALTVLVELGGATMYGTVASISYLDKDGNTQICESATEVTSEDTAWGTSEQTTWYVVNGDVTIGSADTVQRVTVNGNVHLILTDGCNLIVNGGIGVGLDSSLTIYGQTAGTGALEARNVAERNAGIGGGYGGNFSGGAITINGGTITATGGYAGAGIGGGGVSASGYLYDKGGPIIINGGTINANGGGNGAGIGDGKKGAGGRTITINGGTINAIGTDYAAGIGSGQFGSNSGTDNGSIIINISGGFITATGGYKGAGIGGGSSDNGGVTINISGGTINATGGPNNTNGTEYAAGIGEGYYSKKTISVSITNGVVMASSISDKSNQASWNCLAFEGDSGKAYGTSVNVATDCTIPSGKTLEVSKDQTISIADTKTLTNEGTIYNNGTFTGEVINSGIIHNTGTISNVSGGTINYYSISIERTETSCQLVELSLKVDDTAFGESVTYTLNEVETNAEIENGNTLKVTDRGVGTPIPVTATFTVDGVSMTRTEDVTITGHDYDNNGFCTECDAYQPATDSDSDGVYEIGNAGQLYWFADKVNTDNANYGSAKAVLTANISVNERVLVNGELNTSENGSFRSWMPIGNDANPYTGTFDGQGYTVSGLYVNDVEKKYVGLFGAIQSSGCIKKVGVIDSYFNGKDSVGGVCGLNKNGTIESCYNKSYVSGTENIGGVCGYNYAYNGTATIKNCHNEGKVSGSDYVGGVCGYNNDDPEGVATIEYCYNTGEVSSVYHVGGVCGWNRSVHGLSEIANCYNMGKVSGTNYVGGVCGYNYSSGGMSGITKCFNTGKVGGTGDSVGGVCGLNSQESGASATVTNCYYIAGCNTEDTRFTCEEGTSKTATWFASGEATYLLNGSSSENPVWYQNIDRDGETADAYPVLDSNHGTVHQCTPCTVVYSNTPGKTVAHIFHMDENDSTTHTCEKCGYSEAHSTTNLTYSADVETNRITVYCNEGGCGTNIGYVELEAPYGAMTYNGIGKEATISDTVPYVDFSSTPITYKQGETTLSSEPVNAGTYTASITLGEGEGAATVSVEFTIEQATPTISWGMSWGTSWVEITEIPVTYTGSEIAPDKLVPPPTVTLVNGETYSGKISYSYRLQGSSDAFTSGLPTEIGIYEVKASIAADGNYTEAYTERPITLTVNWLNDLNFATLTDQDGNSLGGDDWWAQSVTFTAPNGFTISNSLTDSFGTSFVYNEQTGAEGTEVTYYLKNSAGEIAKKTALVRIDKTAPDWSGENDGISIKTNKWKSLLSTISFGLFYKESVDVKVCANDSISGVVAYYYYIDSTGGMVKTADQLDTLSFTEYTEGVSGQNPSVIVTSLDPNGNYIVYAYAVDATGNRSAYVCSEGVVVDSTAPAISNIVAPSQGTLELTDTTAQISFTGSEAGTYFYIVKEISETAPTTITDFATEQPSDGYSTWMANPNVSFASMTADADNKISLNGLKANTEYTLYLAAVDLAGNSSTVYSQSFTTNKTIPTVADADMPIISGTYGQTVEEMTLTPGIAKAGSEEISGTWTVTDSIASTAKPVVGTTTTYQVTFIPNASYNGMYDTVDVQVTPTVAPKPVNVTAENKTKTYGVDNPAFTFTVPDGALVGTDTKDTLGVTLSCEATKTSPVKEGGYAITGTSSSANYNVTVTPGTLTISKADVQINVDTTTYSKTFGDAAFTLSGISDTNTEANVQYAVTAGDDVLSVSNGTVTILKAGSATITVSLPESANYNAAVSKTITVTVAKKSGYTVESTDRSYVFIRDNADNIDLSGYLPEDCGNITYGTPLVDGALYTDGGQPEVSVDGKLSYTVKRAETYGTTGTIQVAVTTDNYADFTITVNVSLKDQLPVSLKSGSSVTLQNDTLTYGQTLSTLTINSAVFVDGDGNEVRGTLAWKNPDEKPNAGTTSATWVFTPDDASYATLDGYVAITVNKATPQVTVLPTVAGRTYDPNASLTDTDLTGGTVTGADGNSLAGEWNWQSTGIIPTVNNTGYVAVFTPTDTTNYETVTRTITVTVSKATPVIGDVTVTPGSVDNTTDVTSVSLTRADNTVPGELKLDDEALSYGRNTYGWTFTPEDTSNYKSVTGSVTIAVNDTIAPTAKYQIGENGWKKFVNTISFGLFCKDYKTVQITYSDVNASGEQGSGVKIKQYYIADKELTEAEIAALQWNDYSDTISLDAKGVYFIYVKVEDKAGNSVVLNSEGIVIYAESTLSPASMDYTYKENADREVQIALNGNTFGKLTDASGNEIAESNYAIDASGKLTLKADYLDTLGVGEYTYKVYMNPQGQVTDTVTLTYSFVVNVKACELTVTGATATDRAYDKTKAVAITAVELSGVKSGDNVSVDTTNLTGTLSGANAGSYTSVTLPTLTLTGADAGNYKLVHPTAAVTTDVTISKADAAITVGADTYNKTFGDADFTLDVTDTNTEANEQYEVTIGAEVVSVSNGMVTILKAGTATITVSLPASTNYNAAEPKTITVNVAKKSGHTVDAVNRSYFYVKNSADTIDLSTMLPADCGNVTYGTPQVSGELYTSNGQPAVSSGGELSYTVKQAETYGATGTIQVAVTTDNYEDFTITVNITLKNQLPVSLQEGSIVTLQNSTLTYGQALSTLTFDSAVFVDDEDNVVAGTLAWKTPTATPNAGTTSATWVFTPNDESYVTVEGNVAITVKKATPDVTAAPTVAERTYNPIVSLTDSDLAYGTVNVAGNWSWQSAGIIPTVNNSGYVAVFTPTDSTNYETVTRTITVTVSKATPYIETAPTAAAITYGDTLGASALTGGTVQYSSSDETAISGSFAWGDNSVKPSVSDSDTTTYQVIFTPSDTDNYNTVETTVTLTVNKAENTPNMPSSTMNVANSCKKVSDVTLPTDWVWQDTDKDTALTVGTAVTATAVYNGADKGNYENETVSVTITRSACDHAHTELRNAKEATCTEPGYTGDTYCTDCGALLTTGTTILLADHQGGTATCTKKAVCTVCGKEYGELNANNHVHTEIRGAVAATCTAGGYNGDTYCTDCGVKIKTGTATPALGHNYTSKVTTEPTTDREGVRTYTCDRCGHSYTESIPKLPEEEHQHSYSDSVTKEPTCTDTGVRTYTCSCGDSYTETIPALGHNYTSKVTKEPTTSSEGVMTYTCERCGHSYTRAIAKLQDNNNNNPTDNNPGENQPGGENTPDTGKPYIKDETGKEGWEVIKDEVDKTQDGDKVVVEMNGSSVVPGDVLDEIKGEDVTIVFDMGNGITWSVNGQSITSDKIGDIDFSVTIGTTTIPTDVINNVTGERYSQQISLAYDGEFGFTAVLSINMDASNAGLYANLFYYNEKSGELEFICADEIAADGTAELIFTHASDYVIAIDTEPMNVASNETSDTNVDTATSESGEKDTQTSAEARSDAWNSWWIIVIGIMVIVIGAGVFFVVKKREEKEKE